MLPGSHITPIYLAATVPIWIEHLRILDAEHFERTRRRWVSRQPRPQSDDMAELLTAQAQTIAARAFAPDGVDAFGMHWHACRTP